jgi:hypothetical protein
MTATGEWQQRLEDNFSYRGVVGGRLLPLVMEQERLCGAQFIRTFHGHRILTDSFLDFFAQTLDSTAALRYQIGWPQDTPYYVPCLLAFVTQFRGMRAAEILSVNGYPLDGYALQRNLKDQAIFIGSVVSGISSFPALYGLKRTAGSKQPWSKEDHERVFRDRLDEETRVLDHTIGKRSGLAEEHINALGHWNRLFNVQVHGARLASMREADAWVMNKKSFSVGPRIDNDGSAMYMNRSNEVAWMMLRTLPFLQFEDRPFDQSWREKWAVLDESLRVAIEGRGNLGKKIAPAFIAMIDSRFATSPASRYIERG